MTELAVTLCAELGAFSFDCEFVAPAHGITGVFGASGSGKTTLLRSIAGLHRANGMVRVGDVVWQHDERRTFVPAHERGAGLVAQESDLFPHLTVEENLRFAFRRVRDAGRRQPWDAVVEQTGVRPLLNRSPASLSGGERQRAALARALLSSPRLLLLDEPLSALDEPARREVFASIEKLAETFAVPVLYVSHSLLEVARIADRLVWMAHGRVERSGTVDHVLGGMDFNRWRTDDAGVVVTAVVRAHDDDWATTALDGPWGAMIVARQQAAVGARVRIQVLASDVSLGVAPQTDSSILNEFPMRVAECVSLSPGAVLVRMTPRAGGEPVMLARVMRVSAARLGIEPGRDVFARVKAAAVLD
jgi:molybdate transport system ATP-binding protein